MALACTTRDPGPLLGAWRSDEQLTLQEVERAELTPKQRELLAEPGFWGELEVRYEVGRVYSSYEDLGGWLPYRVIDSGPGFAQIEFMDSLTGEITRPKLLLEGDIMKMPIEHLGFYEVFRRVDTKQKERCD
jgi:hypothetical protein